MKDLEDKLSEEEKTELTSAIDELKSAHSSRDIEKIKEGMEKVNTSFQKVSEKIYSQAQEMTENMNGQESEVNDVDFEEVK